jgi:hypothetical protein
VTAVWLLEDGKDITFQNNSWRGPPLFEFLNIPIYIKHLISSAAGDYIDNGH